MNNIALNFVPLLEQDNIVTIYRRRVSDSSQPKNDGDFRANLPDQEGEWVSFDVYAAERDGYEAYEYNFSLNVVLTAHLIYQELRTKLNSNDGDIDYYIPEREIAPKEVHFITKRFEEGFTEIIARPYFLKARKLFGFLLEHKFSLKDDQPFNRKTQILSLSLDKSGKSNIYFYKDKKMAISAFIDTVLYPLLSDTSLGIDAQFSTLTAKNLEVKTYLVGDGKSARSQFMGIKHNGPFRRMDDEVRYLFLFSEKTRSLARDIYFGLVGKLFPGQFSGLEMMFSIPIHKDIVEYNLVKDFDKSSIQDIENKIKHLKSSHLKEKIMVIAVLPKGFKGVEAAFDAYGYLKLMALRNGAYCQVVTEDTFFKRGQLKWSISNIGLQIFSKLGGAPWLVKPAKSNYLIFGVGSVQERIDGSTTKFTAYTVCLNSSGDFKYIKPLSSSSDEKIYLNNLKVNLNKVLFSELGDCYKSLVIHLPYKISRKEIEIIKEVASSIRESEEFKTTVIKINTKHKFLGFSNHNTCVPYESTYVQLSKNEFLIWGEGLQYGKEVLHKRVSEPLYVDFVESYEDWETKEEHIQDILNLTGANWRGFNSKAQPISILYSRLIAKFMKEFSHLESVNDMSIVSAESLAPWFL